VQAWASTEGGHGGSPYGYPKNSFHRSCLLCTMLGSGPARRSVGVSSRRRERPGGHDSYEAMTVTRIIRRLHGYEMEDEGRKIED
jgi:hypothetical protein